MPLHFISLLSWTTEAQCLPPLDPPLRVGDRCLAPVGFENRWIEATVTDVRVTGFTRGEPVFDGSEPDFTYHALSLAWTDSNGDEHECGAPHGAVRRLT